MAVSAAKLEANRRNAQRSTGPKNCERSKFNALKHGMRAETMVLPEEDPQAISEARKASWTARLAPGDDVEQRAVDEAVSYTWLQDRARRAQLARIKAGVLDFGVGEANAVALEVEDLGRRLFTDRLGPATFYPTIDKYRESTSSRSPSTSDAGKGRDDPDRPGPLVLRLRSTLQGCQWMLSEWARLKSILDDGQAWVSSDKLKAVRLLGKQPVDALNDRDVAIVFIASFVLKAVKAEWSWEIMTELNSVDQKRFRDDAASRQLESLKPADGARAREMLLALIARASEQLQAKAQVHRERAETRAALAADYLAFDESPAGERLRRHQDAAGRGVARALNTLFKIRRAPEVVRGPSCVVIGEIEENETAKAIAPGDGLVIRQSSIVSGEDPTNEVNDGSQNAPNEPNGELVDCPSSVVRAADESGNRDIVTNEPNGELVGCPSSVVSGANQSGNREIVTNEPTDVWENVTNEPTDVWENVTNEPTEPWENVTNEPNESEAGDGRPPSSGPAGHLLPGGEGNVTNEPRPPDAAENVTNEPTDASDKLTNEPTDPQATGRHAPSSGPAGHVLPARGDGNADEFEVGAEGDDSEDGSAVRRGWDDPALAADVDWDQTDEWVRQGKEKVRRERAEQLRELNERARREMEASRALRRARHAEQTSRKPAEGTRNRTDEPAESEQKQLKRLTAELAKLKGALVPALARVAASAKSHGP